MRGILKHNELLAPYTSWHIGGPADIYYRPADTNDLVEFFKTLSPETPIFFLGLGSNILVSDEGVRGVVIHLLSLPGSEDIQVLSDLEKEKMGFKDNENVQIKNNTEILRVEACVTAAKLSKFCAKNGLVGAEFFAGIPGTIGGALAMNAGAWGGETWDHVLKVEVMNRKGERFLRDKADYQIGYRSVIRSQSNLELDVKKLDQEWFIGVFFQFERGDSESATNRIKALLKERNDKQPIGVFSCGSVFKNPLPKYAGQLIEASGLKGYVVGDAQVSLKHGNFIINRGNATAKDVLALISHIQTVVLRDYQVKLETEVKIFSDQDPSSLGRQNLK